MSFNDLDLYNKHLNSRIFKSLKQTINKNDFIFGKSVDELEASLCRFTGSKYSISVGSGTDALLLSLMSLNLKKGDEVIIPSFSWLSVLEVVLFLNLKPIFVDTDYNNFNFDINNLDKLISKKTRVIISTSLFGRSIDLKKIKKICEKNKLLLIEDAAQNFGSYIDNLNSCNIADISCTSFFPSKNLGCYGDGGAIFTNKKKINDKLKKLRNHGQRNYNDSKLIGINSRLGTLQAAILNVKLKDLKNKKKKQKKIYKGYVNFFKKNNIVGFPKYRAESKKYDDMNSNFSILVRNRRSLIKYFNKFKIKYKIYYPKPLYKQFNIKKKIYLKNTEFICKKIISLPFNELSEKRFKNVLNKLQIIISKEKGIFFEKK